MTSFDFRVRCVRYAVPPERREGPRRVPFYPLRQSPTVLLPRFSGRRLESPLRVDGRGSRHGRLRQASAPKSAVRGARTSGWVEVGRLCYPEGERGVFSARRASSRGPSVPRERGAPSFWSRKKRQKGRFSFSTRCRNRSLEGKSGRASTRTSAVVRANSARWSSWGMYPPRMALLSG